MNAVKRILSSFCIILLLVSCAGRDKITCMDIPVAVDRHGDVPPPVIAKNAKTVVHYFFCPGNMAFSLDDTPKGKIDRIIQANPDWQFLFYIECKPDEKNQVVRMLDKYDCNFPVMLDYEGKFRKKNLREKVGIGFILNREGHSVGVSVIGDRRSFFDSTFKKAKRIVR